MGLVEAAAMVEVEETEVPEAQAPMIQAQAGAVETEVQAAMVVTEAEAPGGPVMEFIRLGTRQLLSTSRPLSSPSDPVG